LYATDPLNASHYLPSVPDYNDVVSISTGSSLSSDTPQFPPPPPTPQIYHCVTINRRGYVPIFRSSRGGYKYHRPSGYETSVTTEKFASRARVLDVGNNIDWTGWPVTMRSRADAKCNLSPSCHCELGGSQILWEL
jgi:hypothetical protein